MTIRSDSEDSVKDGGALALAALGWVLSDPARAQRFLDLTGLTPESLREAILLPETHRAVFDFLSAYEPDLVSAAESLGVAPADLAGPSSGSGA